MYYVYVIKSKVNEKLYIGSTNNLKRRLAEHRRKTSLKRASFNLVYYEAFASEVDARRREKRIKYFGKAYQELKKRISESLKVRGE